ncbi:hypothetical protein T03_10363 [Trichinella britovi]|uniref:Uncharacterized protein n=1 Tax=Trichinella britovi TaxID=45882 RepID=A0A0V1DDZ2_TRIBR|nr:hypothetical protein T03_10363 [Trichinella britovi]
MAPISEENPIKMGYLYNCLISVAPQLYSVDADSLTILLPFHCIEKRFLNTSHPKKLHRVYASSDGSTKWSDLSDRVIVPCPVFTVAVLVAPSSIGSMSHRVHVPAQYLPLLILVVCVPLSTGVQSGEVFLSSLVPQLRCEVLLIPPSADQVVDPAGCLGAPQKGSDGQHQASASAEPSTSGQFRVFKRTTKSGEDFFIVAECIEIYNGICDEF